jgi:hypothetical protein
LSRVLVYLGRFALIIVGYAIASLAGSAFLNLLYLGSLDLSPPGASGAITGSTVLLIPFVALFVAYFAFAPSIVAIVAAEILGRRDWLYYALAGGAVSVVMLVVMFGARPYAHASPDSIRLVLTIVGAGIVSGVAYWLVVGRSAGSWRDVPDGRLPPLT